MSLSRLELENANVALENVILDELSGKTGNLEISIRHIVNSMDELSIAIALCDLLRDQMDKEGYVDLPPYQSIDLKALGEVVSSEKMVERDAWDDVLAWGTKDGFYGVLAQIKHSLEEISHLSQCLLTQTKTLVEKTPNGGVERELETNGNANLKKEFAQLYSKWHWFGGRFLASSMLSTEVWYVFNNYGSLLDKPHQYTKVA